MPLVFRPGWLGAALVFALLALSARGQSGGALTVYAATSLTDAFEQLRVDFLSLHPGSEIVLNFASSSTLAAQILAGAPADIFASANDAQMALIVDDGLIAADALREFARNQLILALPADNPAGIENMADLADKSLLLVLAARGTPIRAYTDAMLQSYESELGGDYVARVLANLVSEESNVRQVITRVALGEADAGIVYRSDVIGAVSEDLLTLPIDPRHNQLASYPIAALEQSQQIDLARQFIAFVRSARSQDLLTEYGFCPPALDDAEATPAITPTATSAAAATDADIEAEAASCDI